MRLTEVRLGVVRDGPASMKQRKSVAEQTGHTMSHQRLKMILCLRRYQRSRSYLALAAVLAIWMMETTTNANANARARRGARRVESRDNEYWTRTVPGMDDRQYKENFRMDREDVDFLVDRMRPHWPVCHLGGGGDVGIRRALHIFLYRLGSSSCCRIVANQFGVGRSTVIGVTTRTLHALLAAFGKLIQTPRTEADWKRIAERWNQTSKLRGIVGAIDGTHIPICRPFASDLAEPFFNRKGYYSYNVQAVCDDRGIFINVAVGAPGCMNDSGILNRSSFCQIGEATIPARHYVVGDGGYPSLLWLVRPYEQLFRNRILDDRQTYFNRAHASTRGIIERSFGLLKQRWRKLLTTLDMRNQDQLKDLILAAFVLHNFCELRERYPGVDIDGMIQPPPFVAPYSHPLTAAELDRRRREAQGERDAMADVLWQRAVGR